MESFDISINIMLIIVAIAALGKAVDGYKKGIVKEVISLISMIVLCLTVALIANGVSSYLEGRFINVVLMIILFTILGIAHHFLKLVLFPAKLAAKLPIVHFIDKLLGFVFGAAEVILILWTVYTFIMMMDMGAIGQIILSYTEDSEFLSWLYQHNYLAYGIERMLEEFSFIPLQLFIQ